LSLASVSEPVHVLEHKMPGNGGDGDGDGGGGRGDGGGGGDGL
jgi:hypothetical protein